MFLHLFCLRPKRCLSPSGALDLDDFRAQIAQRLGGIGAEDELRQVDDGDAVKRPWHGRFPRKCLLVSNSDRGDYGMAEKGQAPVKPIMTEAGITAKTGKGWDYWFKALDKAGAAKLDHKGIVAILNRKMKVGPWWGQMIAVSYERARGIRAVNQKRDGEFSVSVTKVMPVGLSEAVRRRDDARDAQEMVPARHVRGNLARPRTSTGAARGRRTAGWKSASTPRAQARRRSPCSRTSSQASRCGRDRACRVEEGVRQASERSC